MKKILCISLNLLIYLSPLISKGQKLYKTVLGAPENFVMPVDNPDPGYLEQTVVKSKENIWLVTADRDEAPFYDIPDGTDAKGTLEYGKHYIVFEERNGWILVGDLDRNRVNGLKLENVGIVTGWVSKKNVLLWRTGLVDVKTKIHRKVVLLNRADDINNVASIKNKLRVDVYTSPTNGNKIEDIKVLDFYFVYKEEKNRLLIGTRPSLDGMSKILVGWIPRVRTQPWNTRICLEPNFEPEAFNERRQNPAFRIKAFGDQFKAASFCAKPEENPSGIFWDGDPVIQPPNRLAKDGRRFIGNVMRMPLIRFGEGAASGTYFYETGMVGEIDIKPDGSAQFISKLDEIDEAMLADRVQDWGIKSSTVNVFFVIEGTEYTYEYREALINAVSGISSRVPGGKTLKYGMLVYRDIPEAEVTLPAGNTVNRMIELMPLTPDREKAVRFLNSIDFSNKVDTDTWTAMFYGLSEALKKGGFKEDETNIMFVIGSFGDFRANKFRREDAKNTQSPALFEDTNMLMESLAKLDVNLYGCQLRDNQMSESNAFSSGIYNMILGSSKIPYNKRYANPSNSNMAKVLEELKKDKLLIREPYMPDSDGEESELILSYAVHPGFIQRPATGKNMAKVRLTEAILNGVDQSVTFTEQFHNILTRMYSTIGNSYAKAIEKVYEGLTDDGASLGYYAPAFALFLEKNLTDIGRDDLVKTAANKYHLYSTVFVPARINGAKNSVVSYSLCMPQQDMLQYKNTIELCLSTSVSGTAEKRRSLYEVYRMLFDQFSGEQYSKTGFDNLETTDVLLMMQGISPGEADDLKGILRLDLPVLKLKDILDEKKVSNSEIDRLMKRFADVNDRFEDILRSRRYEFKFGNDDNDDERQDLNVIYWMPIKEVF